MERDSGGVTMKTDCFAYSKRFANSCSALSGVVHCGTCRFYRGKLEQLEIRKKIRESLSPELRLHYLYLAK